MKNPLFSINPKVSLLVGIIATNPLEVISFNKESKVPKGAIKSLSKI
jgi:hypothetical protein